MLKTDPKYGHYPWWPQDGDDWLHGEDVELARRMIPGPRIFRRDGAQGPYVVMSYGDIRLRVRRTLWQEVAWERFDIGDWVEVLSCGQRNTPSTGTIREMLWDAHDRCIHYQLLENGQPLANRYTAEDLRHVDPTPPYSAESSTA
jgi:hypothetical protein